MNESNRMKKLAGILKEVQLTEAKKKVPIKQIRKELDKFVDKLEHDLMIPLDDAPVKPSFWKKWDKAISAVDAISGELAKIEE